MSTKSISFVSMEGADAMTLYSFMDPSTVPYKIPTRAISDCFRDLVIHSFEIVSLIFLSQNRPPVFRVRYAKSAKFWDETAGLAVMPTACRVELYVDVEDESFEFSTRILKGAPSTSCAKYLSYPGKDRVSLSGGSFKPHQRVFSQLFGNRVTLPLQLKHHALISGLCAQISEIAEEEDPYEFGSVVPDWLT